MSNLRGRFLDGRKAHVTLGSLVAVPFLSETGLLHSVTSPCRFPMFSNRFHAFPTVVVSPLGKQVSVLK